MQAKGFPTTGWPAEIHAWIKRVRMGTLAITDVDVFATKWSGWWTSINPEWRSKGRVLVKETKGSWEGMRMPGANGFFSVLVALKWWKDVWGIEEEDESWAEAVGDVKWVLTQLGGGKWCV
ncbi:hypothetical protein FB451DRAFT_1031411 [Mycena latifolia]|nr:hypothetical protein FB451DRAFT_1031411 [Mycena latifolia]